MEGWSESDSEQFLSLGEVITPSRDEQMEMLASLVPAEPGEAFQIVELGCGGGELAGRLLERFPRANYLGLDGSATMLGTAQERLAPFAERVALRSFRLEERDTWRSSLPVPVRCLVSSLENMAYAAGAGAGWGSSDTL